ncbi:Unknown protein sequence [Pseudomonas syringae pv. syringae]|nr:Unknown protein sequence [Pseudomonas syringae pv. aceris]KPB29835.1 Unknown protein sequence [Pseudomonas syringae pv. syringae]
MAVGDGEEPGTGLSILSLTDIPCFIAASDVIQRQNVIQQQ